MARPRNAIPGRDLHVVLPEDVAGWLEVYLYSPAEQRIPTGAKARFIAHLIREFRERIESVHT